MGSCEFNKLSDEKSGSRNLQVSDRVKLRVTLSCPLAPNVSVMYPRISNGSDKYCDLHAEALKVELE